MYLTKSILIHLFDIEDNLVQKALINHTPNAGDYARLTIGGVERFYKITQVLYAYDEPTCPYDRVNAVIEELEETDS